MNKNITVAECLFENEDILPYLCLCWGDDFATDYIIAKLESANKFYKLNTTYTNISNLKHKPISLYTKISSPYSVEEIKTIMKPIVVHSTNYFIKKYF